MAWVIDLADGLGTVISADGLTSDYTPAVDRWVRDQGGIINVDPVHSVVDYDPNNEGMVLVATLAYLADIGFTPTVTSASVDPYVASGPDYDAQRGLDY